MRFVRLIGKMKIRIFIHAFTFQIIAKRGKKLLQKFFIGGGVCGYIPTEKVAVVYPNVRSIVGAPLREEVRNFKIGDVVLAAQ